MAGIVDHDAEGLTAIHAFEAAGDAVEEGHTAGNGLWGHAAGESGRSGGKDVVNVHPSDERGEQRNRTTRGYGIEAGATGTEVHVPGVEIARG